MLKAYIWTEILKAYTQRHSGLPTVRDAVTHGQRCRVFVTSFHKENKQKDEYCKEFRILDLSKGKQSVGHRNFSSPTVALSYSGHYYLTDPTNSSEHLPQGEQSILRQGLSQAGTDGWLQLQPR